MEDQGQMNHVSGFGTQDHHQVHHCRKCGWPFPKPHPSAKHRRAHKKICGTVEGYNLHHTSNTTVSDDDHSDDGDYKSPQISFKRLERSPSEDDVYSDAVSNFADASLNSGVGGNPAIASESPYSVEKVSEVTEFGASAEGTSAGNLTSSVTVQAPMTASTTAGGSGKRSDSGDLSSTIVAETQFSSPEGAPKVHENDADSLVELLTEIKSPVGNDATAEFSPNDERKVTEEIIDTPDAAESMLQATDIADPNEGFAPSVEKPNGKLVSETPQKDISPEHFAVQESEGADSGDVEHSAKAADEEVHLLHVPHDAPAVEHPEKIIQGFKDHPKKEDVQPDNFEFKVKHSPSVGEYNRIKEEDLKANEFSVPQEVPVLANEEKIIAGFKDYKKMGWVGHDNRDLPNAVEEKGEFSCLASDLLLEKDGLISNPIDQEVEVTAAVHESLESDNLRDVLDDAKKKGIPDEEASLEDVTLMTSREIDSNMHVKPAEEVHAVPDSVSTTHTAGEYLLGGEAGVIKEEEVTDVVKSLSDTVSVLSLDNGAPRTTLVTKDDSIDSNSAVEIVSTGDRRDKNVEEEEVSCSAFLSSEAPSAVEDGCVNESCVGIHHPTLPDSVTVTGAEAILKGSAEEEEVSGTVDTRTLSLQDSEGDNTISTVVTSEFDGIKEDVKFADDSSSSFSVTEKLSRDVENGTKAEEEESSVGLHSRVVVGDSAASEIGIVHVAEDGGVRKEAAAEESSVQSSLLDESVAAKSSLDDSVVMQNRGVDVVESRKKSAEEDANETVTDGGLEAETTTVVVDEVLAENEELKKGDEVEGSSSSMNELGHEVEKEAALLSVGVSQVPNSLTAVEEGGGYEASLQSEDGTKPHQQLTASVLDASSSRSESLDANWGSVSVLSTQSDTIIPSDEPREVGKPNTQQQGQQASVETTVRHPDKLETSFEAPSVVESSSVSQGQFLTSTQAAAAGADYSPGRKKKKEEIIAKVTNWTAKQPQEHSSPLKNLLVEANRETKPISSPIMKENEDIAPTTKFEEEKKKNDSVKDNGAASSSSTVASILTNEAKAPAAAISEEWNSPARYPSEIKREKKAKGRPYWAQFVCCSSSGN